MSCESWDHLVSGPHPILHLFLLPRVELHQAVQHAGDHGHHRMLLPDHRPEERDEAGGEEGHPEHWAGGQEEAGGGLTEVEEEREEEEAALQGRVLRGNLQRLLQSLEGDERHLAQAAHRVPLHPGQQQHAAHLERGVRLAPPALPAAAAGSRRGRGTTRCTCRDGSY